MELGEHAAAVCSTLRHQNAHHRARQTAQGCGGGWHTAGPTALVEPLTPDEMDATVSPDACATTLPSRRPALQERPWLGGSAAFITKICDKSVTYTKGYYWWR